MYKDAIAGSLAGITSEIITLPVSVIKTKYQVSNSNLKNIFKQNLFKSILKSSIPAISQKILSNGLRFSLYYHFMKNSEKKYSFSYGFVTGIISSAITTPVNVLKIRSQIGKTINKKKLFNGIKLSILRSVSLNTIQLPIFEFIKSSKLFGNKSNFKTIIPAILTTFIVTTIIHPIDFMMVKKMSGENLSNKNLFKILKENPYKGFGLNICRVMPNFIITTYLFNIIKPKLEQL
jgi:hypothetical protein